MWYDIYYLIFVILVKTYNLLKLSKIIFYDKVSPSSDDMKVLFSAVFKLQSVWET